MISKSYIVEDKKDFFINEQSVLFYGENLGLKNDFKRNFKTLNQKSCFITLNQDEIIKDKSILLGEINNASLFDERKIIFIEFANDKIFEILKEAFDYIDKNKIIVFSDMLDKKSTLRNFYEKSGIYKTVPCYEDNELSLRKIILKVLKDFKGLSEQNINLIIEKVNLDRSKLYNELEKIILYFHNKNIQTNSLNMILDNPIIDNFNLLKDAAFLGNKFRTNKLLSDTVLDSEKSVYYLNLINQKLFKLKQIREIAKTSNLGIAINQIKPPIFWKEKENTLNQAKKWNSDIISKVLNETQQIEIDLKTKTDLNKTVMLKKLILDICSSANSS